MNVELEASLRSAIEFTGDDLIFNRSGKLSDHQIQKLTAKKQSSLQGAGFAIGFTALAFTINFFAVADKYSDEIRRALVICGLLAIVLIYIWLNWSRYTSDLDRGVAFAAEGKLEFIVNYNRGGSVRSRAVRINNAYFPIDKRLFELLTEVAKNNPYCAIYYTPKANIILSIEALNYP